MVADAGEPTSTCFFARLPGASLGAAGAERLEKWAAANCVEHALVRGAGGSVALYAMRSSGRTARQFQTLLRTLDHHWGMKLGRLEDKKWLSLLSPEDFQAAVQGARGATESAEEHDSRADVMPQGAAQSDAVPERGPCRRCAEEVQPVVMMSLSEGFDERARAALAGLRACAAY